jgi:hypothetical protein
MCITTCGSENDWNSMTTADLTPHGLHQVLVRRIEEACGTVALEESNDRRAAADSGSCSTRSGAGNQPSRSATN